MNFAPAVSALESSQTKRSVQGYFIQRYVLVFLLQQHKAEAAGGHA